MKNFSVYNHSFHIPVMGTGFTIDTALKVALYWISSVMSVDDNLMEKMREYYSGLYGEHFEPIAKNAPDSRARRITAYLNFVHRAVTRQFHELKVSEFKEGTEITKYFDLLDDCSSLKQEYNRMLGLREGVEKTQLQQSLRDRISPGPIDINILTKLDRENYKKGQKLPREYADGHSALRGFAKSELNSSVVFSAGLNPYLYSYVENFDCFYADAGGAIEKKITLKVSDFRSALIQGKIFAKKGIWISEYRIESGLNCGGHAFPTDGCLLGPILEEFKTRRGEFTGELFKYYRAALAAKKGIHDPVRPAARITVQGGIGTSSENRFLLRYFELDGTGWATPFLLVPEVTSVDPDMLEKLLNVDEDTVYLSGASPLGVPIYNLRNSASELTRLKRIAAGRPGSPCLNKYMAFNTEFTEEPICSASSHYQTKKIAELNQKGLGPEEYAKEYEKIVEKACVCHDLGDGVLAKYGLSYKGYNPVPAVCPGPNLVYFSKLLTLREMAGHIYGKINILSQKRPRPHMFINELRLYIQYFKNLISSASPKITAKEAEYFAEFKQNLLTGIEYYRNLVNHFIEESEQSKKEFMDYLSLLREELEKLTGTHPAVIPV